MRSVFVAIAFAVTAACVSKAETTPSPQITLAGFEDLARAYAQRDAAAAAATYTEDASVIYAYDRTPETVITGRETIEASFAEFFSQFDPSDRLDLDFRIASSAGHESQGFYRLRVGRNQVSYGRFDVVMGAEGRFVSDRSSSATLFDFEELPGDALGAGDEDENDLARSYYGLLAGRYALDDGCILIVTRSFVRMFVRNSCDNTWRGLSRKSGLTWTGDDQVLPREDGFEITFAPTRGQPSASLTITTQDAARVARRETPYREEDVTFVTFDGTRLAGTIYLPSGVRDAERRDAVVMIHGSGPQDRDGYASIIAVMADEIASQGRIVLAFDKRGSGQSEGDGNNAGFDILARDAIAAMDFLAAREHVARESVGLAGSSQAGWVAAKAIELGVPVADVFLLNAAGTAFTVREQNLYNTEVRMTCDGIGKADRDMALVQQAAFFDALEDSSRAERLDAITQTARTNTAIADWLFPDSGGLATPGAWFSVLDPAFDPLPIWTGYEGETTIIFSEFDDATDSAGAAERFDEAGLEYHLLDETQHLGLLAPGLCDAGLAERDRFHPAVFEQLREFAR